MSFFRYGNYYILFARKITEGLVVGGCLCVCGVVVVGEGGRGDRCGFFYRFK